MRDLRKGRKLGREKDQRNALLASLAVALISHGKIKTTTAKAKELRPYIERLVTYAKKGGMQGMRLVGKTIPRVATQKLVRDIAPKYAERKGGYTRIVHLEARKRDAAKIAFIEFV
jgi:large subunit ribosomal protein L17